jgi:fucose 4-O-acetylase-like acetyltransferase
MKYGNGHWVAHVADCHARRPTIMRSNVVGNPERAGVRRADQGIQTFRGIAVVLMVAGHVIGGESTVGLTVSDDSGWRFFYAALADLRMPLFAVLSGYVYAYRPVRFPADLGRLLTGKIRRLIVPFLVVGTVFYAVRMVAPGVNVRPRLAEFPEAMIYGFAHLWFLQAIFLIFLTVGLLDAHGVLASYRSWAVVTLCSMALFILVWVPDQIAVFSLNGALRLLPFFLLGYGAHRYAAQLLRPALGIAATVAFVPVYGLRLWAIATDVVWPDMVVRAHSVAVAALLVVTLLAVRRHLESPALSWLGGFSFAIYLLHVFGAAGARALATHLGVESNPVLFAFGMIAGIGLPILFELTFGRFRPISWAVLGQRPRRRPSADALAAPEPVRPEGALPVR